MMCQSDPLPLSEPEDLKLDHAEGIVEDSTESENNVTEETTVKSVEIAKDHCSSRPVRKRIKPKWMNSGEFVMSIQNNQLQDPD